LNQTAQIPGPAFVPNKMGIAIKFKPMFEPSSSTVLMSRVRVKTLLKNAVFEAPHPDPRLRWV
jgi:hypothetical protein